MIRRRVRRVETVVCVQRRALRIGGVTTTALLVVILVTSLLGLTPTSLGGAPQSARAEDSQRSKPVLDGSPANLVFPEVSSSSASTVLPATDPAQHYVVFLAGLDSSSSSVEPISSLFAFARDGLSRNLHVSRFIYFSYAAAAAHNAGNDYCAGWRNGCAASSPGAVRFGSPTYAKGDTHLSIDDQAMALEWMLGEIIRVDADARIDLVGYSLGGVIAARWAALRGASTGVSAHVHSIVLLESPVGGIPAANLVEGPLCAALEFCLPLKFFLEARFGSIVLRQLQVPTDERSRSESIVQSLSEAGRLFRVTSIQSTVDYLVNGTYLQFCLEASCTSPGGFLAGSGSQGWGADRQTLHFEYLGGDSSPIRADNLPTLAEPMMKRLMENHGLPLWDPSSRAQVSTWIAEAVSDGASR